MTEELELLTCAEVAVLFRVDPKTVTRWARDRRLPHIVTPGGHRRYPADRVRRILEANTVSELDAGQLCTP